MSIGGAERENVEVHRKGHDKEREREGTTIMSAATSRTTIDRLFITLKRGLAGKKETHVKTATALGLRHTNQTVEQPNNSSVRGAIDKIKHLVLVETDVARAERLAAEGARERLGSVRVRHEDMVGVKL